MARSNFVGVAPSTHPRVARSDTLKVSTPMPKTSPKAPTAPRAFTIADMVAMSPGALTALVNEATDHVRTALRTLPVGLALGRAERRTSTGKIGDDELKELEAILDVIDASPQVFASLAPRDGGVDPAVVETAPTRRAIALLRALAPLTKAARELGNAVSDLRMRVGEQVREVTVTARAIAKANAPADATVRAGLATVEALRSERVKPRTKKP